MVWAVALMIVLNVMMVMLTLGTKVLRSVGERKARTRNRRLESALDNFLATGNIPQELLQLGDRDMDHLALLMVEYLSVLSGTEGSGSSGWLRSPASSRGTSPGWAPAAGGAKPGPPRTSVISAARRPLPR